MAEPVDSDVLMFFVAKEGTPPIAAESTSALAGNDARLMQGFVEGRYFEADNFSFSIQLADDEGGNVMDESESRSYGRWRILLPEEPKPNPPFRAEPPDASISRRIDASSPVLLKHCLDKTPISQAVLVKRSRIGGTGMLSTILRLEFTKVWLRSIEWEDEDAVRETCKFRYGALKATYVQRKPDGSVGALFSSEWTSERSTKPAGR